MVDCLPSVPSVWAGAASCQALKCPSLLVETSRVVWLSVAWQKHMAVIWASWGAEMVVFSTKLHVTRVWLVIVTLFSSHERETLTDPAAHRQTAVTSVPLRLFIESPQLQVQLQLSNFLMSFLHRRQPRARGVKRRFDHLELL